MGTTLETRVKVLEGGGTGSRCPECGFRGNWREVKVRIEPSDSKGGPENCGTCGRPTRIVLNWGGKA